MQERVYNFSAGPAVLPLSVLEKARDELVALPGVGASVLEISHRSKPFEAIIQATEANLRKLLSIPENYRVLFLQGGATLQFAMAPMNLLRGTGKSADYVVAGSWGKKAMAEAQKQGDARKVWDGSADNFRTLPADGDLDLNPEAAYVHFTSNETIQGIQFKQEPSVGDVPLLCDSSSDLLCRPVDVSKYGILYACAQKNVGPAGVTIVIIRDDLVERSGDDLPSLLSYKVMADAKSLLNTPPCFAIYMVKLVTEWLLDEIGGLDKMQALNQEKAQLLYDALDNSGGFYIGHADPAYRSIMNVAFRLPNEELDAAFLAEAAERGLTTLKGHRSVGGCRASIYNAMPREGVAKLRDFMLEFQEKNAK